MEQRYGVIDSRQGSEINLKNKSFLNIIPIDKIKLHKGYSYDFVFWDDFPLEDRELNLKIGTTFISDRRGSLYILGDDGLERQV